MNTPADNDFQSAFILTQQQTNDYNDLKKSLASYKNLLVEVRGSIVIIKLNRPKVKNAFDRPTVYEIIRALNFAANDARISFIVLTGNGDFFSSGNDLKQIENYEDRNLFYKTANYVLRSLTSAFINCRKVIVAIVNGPAIGFGFTLCGLCDIVYCTGNAYFQAPFTQAGLCPEACSSLVFPQIMGRSKASEALLFGHRISPHEAYDFNFVSEIFKDENDLTENLWPRLDKFSKLSPAILEQNKSLLMRHVRNELATTMLMELKELKVMRQSEENQKFVQNFLQRKQNKSKL